MAQIHYVAADHFTLYKMTRIKEALANLANFISPFDESSAKYIRKLGGCSPQQIADDLSVWGGAGSLMDQGIASQPRAEARGFEASAIELGHAMVEAGACNKRMERWIQVFEAWAKGSV